MFSWIHRCTLIFPNLLTNNIDTCTLFLLKFPLQVVTSPLTVQVIPPVLTMDIGKSAEFTCWTNSPEETDQSTERQISWRKDGIELKVIEIRSSPRLSITESGEKLRIANVQREDKGIYQCFVKFDSDMAQAAAELRLGGMYVVTDLCICSHYFIYVCSTSTHICVYIFSFGGAEFLPLF